MLALLVGASHETLTLAKRKNVSVTAVCDPNYLMQYFLDLRCFSSDEKAVAEANFERVILAIDSPSARVRADRFFSGHGKEPIDLIDGIIDAGTRWGDGLLLQHGALVSVDCLLGRCVRINVGALVMHDVLIGDYATLAPRVSIMGRVHIGKCSYIGAGATVLPNIRIGANCIVGAGAVVTRDISDGQVVKGNPAK